MKIYFGTITEENRNIFATVTGQMIDGTLVYTEIEQTNDGAIIKENGAPKLVLDNQFTRQLRKGFQTFTRL